MVTVHGDGRYSVSTPEGWSKGATLNARAQASFLSEYTSASITHDRAELAARRLIGSHFGLSERPKITVPPRASEDDDFVLMAYVRQQRTKDALTNAEETDHDA